MSFASGAPTVIPIHTPIGLDEVQRIQGIGDPVLRNLWITQAYHDLAVRLAGVHGAVDASWLGFGVWASKTAGMSIRNEALPEILRGLLDNDEGLQSRVRTRAQRRHRGALRLLEKARRRGLSGLYDQVVERVRANIAVGNLLVFNELGPVFVGLIDLFERAAPRKPPQAEIRTLVQQASIQGNPRDEEQVRSAFLLYAEAADEQDAGRRAELILLANLRAVLHEQRRLQAPLENALDAAVDIPLRELLYSRLSRWWRRRAWLRSVVRWLEGPLESLTEAMAELWREAVTEHVLTLDIAGERLRLGDPLRPHPGRSGLFPAALRAPSEADLVEFLGRWDHGATNEDEDWTELTYRMSYICTLFRSRQQEPGLLAPPFTPDQVRDLKQLRIPAGDL